MGHPYAHPEGVCINGLGALPSPYGPTLRGAHNGPSGLQKKNEICGLNLDLGHFISRSRCESAAIFLWVPPWAAWVPCIHVRMCPSPSPSHRTKSGKIQIMIVLVFILSRYWFKSIIFLKVGARKGTHMHPKGALEGPKEPAKEKEITKWNRAKYVRTSMGHPTCIHACPEGAIISRSGTEKWVPDRVPIWVPLWGAH